MAVDFMTNQVTKIQSAAFDESTAHFFITLVRNDGAEIILEIMPATLAELAGLAGMAVQLMSEDGRPVVPVDSPVQLVGAGASPNHDNTRILLRLEDSEGFLHDFEGDERKFASLRFQLRRAIETLRKPQTDAPKPDRNSIKLAVDNPEKNFSTDR